MEAHKDLAGMLYKKPSDPQETSLFRSSITGTAFQAGQLDVRELLLPDESLSRGN
jgi:hypothetical protein